MARISRALRQLSLSITPAIAVAVALSGDAAGDPAKENLHRHTPVEAVSDGTISNDPCQAEYDQYVIAVAAYNAAGLVMNQKYDDWQSCLYARPAASAEEQLNSAPETSVLLRQ